MSHRSLPSPPRTRFRVGVEREHARRLGRAEVDAGRRGHVGRSGRIAGLFGHEPEPLSRTAESRLCDEALQHLIEKGRIWQVGRTDRRHLRIPRDRGLSRLDGVAEARHG